MTTELSTQNESIVSLFGKNEILNDSDFKDFKDCQDFIVNTYLTVPMYRPMAVKIFGVLSDPQFQTNEAKYWQCKSEAEVHANELIRDLHDLEKMRIKVEKSQWILEHKMNYVDPNNDRAIVEFDKKSLAVNISLMKFEYAQLQKKIKYRIEEIKEWKTLSEKLEATPDFKKSNYGQMILQSLEDKWSAQLQDPLIKDNDKLIIKTKLTALLDAKNFKAR
jgi:hypothetical protein